VTDINDDPVSINARLKKTFSFVLHHADPNVFPLASLEPFVQTALSGVAVRQTGFVRRPFTPTNRGQLSSGLLLTIGGGSAAGARLLKRWIAAARGGSADLFPVVAVCGPLTSLDDRKMIRAEEGRDIIVHDWVSNMDDLISSSRAVVCLGGYNTPVEALSQDKPVLAFPYRELGDQVFQIKALHARGAVMMGDADQTESEITALMNELPNFRPKYKIDSNGAQRSVDIIKEAVSVARS
jgi:predicted glycosyltransferase